MKLFRGKSKSENDEEENELALDTDAEEETGAEDEANPAESAAPSPPDDLFAQIRADGAEETAAEENPAEGAASLLQTNDPLDPGLMDLFREAKEEVQEATLASELADIPIQELLGDLESLSQLLGIEPRARPASSQQILSHRDSELDQGSK